MTHILLIEDNPIDARLMQRFLEARPDWTVAITCIDDVQKALQYLQALENDDVAEAPAMVLLDVNLPKYDGLQVLNAFRQSATGRDLPVFLLSSTAADQIETAAASRNLRADAYFKKPTGLLEFEQLAQCMFDAARTNFLAARTAAA